MTSPVYNTLFGTTGAGQRGSKAGIGTLFGQQAKPPMTDEERQQRQQQQQAQPQQTFAQLQKQGMARPAPQAPQGQPFQRFGGSEQAQQARTGMLGQLQQQLAQPTRFDTQAFQQIRQAQSAQLGAEYQAQQAQLNEELARRGLSASSIGGGRMGDLAGQQARALAQLDAQLLQQAAQTQAQDRLAAMQAASQFAELAGAQDLSQFEANRVAQAAEFEQALRGAQFGQQQTEFERGQALAAAQAQQAGGFQAMELGLRQALGLGELGLGERRQAAQEAQFGQTLAEQTAARLQQAGLSGRELDLRAQQLQQEEALQGRQLTIEEARLAAQQEQFGQSLEEQRAAREAQVTQAQRELAQRQAEALSQQSGAVYEVNADGQVVEKRINGQPIRTESALARLSQEQLQRAELTGEYKNADGTSVSTIAAQRLSQENLRALADQAAQRSQLTGQMHKVDDAGNVVLDTDARGNPISTETRRAQMVQERNTDRQLSQAQAEARTQQTGLSFLVGPEGNIVADIDPATGRQRTTAQAQQFQAQLNQQKELAAAELTGTIRIGDREVSTVAARRLGQEGVQLALQQAAQLSQQTGNVYEVNDAGQVIPKVGRDGTPIRTESALARLSTEKLQQAELTGQYTDANGVVINTLAAKQLNQAQLAQLAEQAARQSQLTGQMYTVNDKGQVVQELVNGQTVPTESRRAQQVQEANVARQIAQARADALSQQSGLSYTVNDKNEVVPDNDPATGSQRTTVQAQQIAAQTEQAKLERQLREQLGMTEALGVEYTRDPVTGRLVRGTQQTVQMQQLANQQRMQEAELKGYFEDASGNRIDTVAARQLTQQEQNSLAEQAARQSQLTGFMYKVGIVNGKPAIVQEMAKDAQGRDVPVTTEARRAQVQQEDQARLERELRERLGMGELTGRIGDQDTLAAQQQAFNQQQQQNQLFIQLAGILAQSGSTGTAGFLNQLMSALGVPNANIGGQQETTADDRFLRSRFQPPPVTTPTGITRTTPMTTTPTTTRTAPQRGL